MKNLTKNITTSEHPKHSYLPFGLAGQLCKYLLYIVTLICIALSVFFSIESSAKWSELEDAQAPVLVVIDSAVQAPDQLAQAVQLERVKSAISVSIPTRFQLNTSQFMGRQYLELQRLRHSRQSSIVVLTLNPEQHPLIQINQALERLGRVAQIHILSHGSANNLNLGGLALNTRTLPQHARMLSPWKKHLTKDAELYLYACELAQTSAGQQLVNQLAALLDIEVAASTDITGSPKTDSYSTLKVEQGDKIHKQPNWKLEYRTAAMRSKLTANGYQHTLVVRVGPNADFDDDGTKNVEDIDADHDGISDRNEQLCESRFADFPPGDNQLDGETVITNSQQNSFTISVDGPAAPAGSTFNGNPQYAYASAGPQGRKATFRPSADADQADPAIATHTFDAPVNDLQFTVDHLTAGAQTDEYIKVTAYYEDRLVPNKYISAATPGGSSNAVVAGNTGGLVADDINKRWYNSNGNDSNVNGNKVVYSYTHPVDKIELHAHANNRTDTAAKGVGVSFDSGCDSIDTDGDGNIDEFDLDSDNDGIADMLEAGGLAITNISSLASTYPAGQYNATPNTNGLSNNANSGAGWQRGTGLDLDADNDGIPDAIEAQATLGYASVRENDVNNNGVGSNGSGQHPLYAPNDEDNDSTPDFLDTNSDNDVLSDNDEIVPAQTANFSYSSTDAGVEPSQLRNVQKSSTAEVDFREYPVIADKDEAGNVDGLNGNSSLLNILDNDTENERQATLSNVSIETVTVTSTPPGAQTNSVMIKDNGDVEVKPFTEAGQYRFVYTICSTTFTDECDVAVVEINVAAVENIKLTKQASDPRNNPAQGDTITYSFSVENTGNVSLSDVNVYDNKLNQTLSVADLAPGTSRAATADYQLTQDDIDSGRVRNTAKVSAEDPDGNKLTDTSNVSKTLNARPNIRLNKTASGPGANPDVSDTITYSFAVENTGNVSLSDVNVYDNKLNQTLSVANLAPGASQTVTADYQLTESDINTEQVVNRARVTAEDPDGDTVRDNSRVTTTFDVHEVMAVKDQADDVDGLNGNPSVLNILDNDSDDGNQATLSNVTIETITVASTPPGAQTNSVMIKDNGDVEVKPFTEAGQYRFVYTICSTTFTDECDPAAVEINVAAVENIKLTKQASDPGANPSVGDTITYSFIVENTGNVNVTDAEVYDAKLDRTLSITGTLAPGASQTVTADYQLTQNDLNSGEVRNTASVTGEDPEGNPVEETSSVTTPLNTQPNLSLTKQASDPGTNPSVGDTITYSFIVENTGNVNVTDAEVYDAKLDRTLSITGTLAPGASQTVTADYQLTQNDLNSGEVRNTASVTGEDPEGNPVEETSSVTTPLNTQPNLSLTKQASDPGTNPAVGDTITYSFIVENTGNVNVTDAEVYDAKLDRTLSITGTLAPGASQTVTADYQLTQNDLNSGEVRNTASVTGEDPEGNPVEETSSVTTPLNTQPNLSLTKQASDPGTNPSVGDTITYSFIVENTGNVNVTDAEVYDAKLDRTLSITGTLAPGASQTVTADYQLTQNDLNSGEVRNTASVTGEDPEGNPVEETSSVTTPLNTQPNLSLTKQASDPGTNPSVGDTITYSFIVENTGNVNVTDAEVYDAKLDRTLSITGTLAPGASQTVTADYQLTQNDLNSGEVRNTASVTGEDPEGNPVEETSSVTTPLNTQPNLSLTKQASDPGTNPSVGDTITYSFIVENTGNVNVTDAEVYDAKLDRTLSITGTLAPGASQTVTADYQLTQNDLNSGEVRNTASVTGEDPEGNPVEETSSVTTPLNTQPNLSLTKQASDPGTNPSVGDTITYSFIVENTGNVNVTDAEVYDAKLDRTLSITGTLAPGASQTVTADYQLTQNDLNSGEVRNTASVTGEDPEGNPVKDTSSVTTTFAASAMASIEALVWFDKNSNRIIDLDEQNILGYRMTLSPQDADDSSAIVVNPTPNGRFLFPDIEANTNYILRISDGQGNLVNEQLIAAEDLPKGSTMQLQIPIDSSGFVYDSVTRKPIAGARLALIDEATGNEVTDECLARLKSGQVTAEDGRYELFLITNNPACVSSGEFSLEVTPPENYGVSTNIPPQKAILNQSDCSVDGIKVDAVPATGNICDVQSQKDIPTVNEAASTRYYTNFRIPLGSQEAVHNHIPLDPINSIEFNIDKRVNEDEVSIGDIVRYSIDIEAREETERNTSVNLHDLLPDGLTLVKDSIKLTSIPTVGARAVESIKNQASTRSNQLIVSWLAKPATAYQLSYIARISAGTTSGVKVNRAQMQSNRGQPISNVGEARVQVGEDPILDKLTIIGKVFQDINQNGIQDGDLGEPGIAGARVVSLQGLVITSDQYGRFHIPGISAGARDRGRNFMLKVDPSSLPSNAVFTTENPRVQRITPGLMTRYNFGVNIPLPQVSVKPNRCQPNKLQAVDYKPYAKKIESVYFSSGQHNILPQTVRSLETIISELAGKATLRFEFSGYADSDSLTAEGIKRYGTNMNLSRQRARVVAYLIAQRLGLSEDQLSIQGMGMVDDSPNQSEKQKQSNRRTDIKVYYTEKISTQNNCKPAAEVNTIKPEPVAQDVQQPVFFKLKSPVKSD